jgi:hypothetical protein
MHRSLGSLRREKQTGARKDYSPLLYRLNLSLKLVFNTEKLMEKKGKGKFGLGWFTSSHDDYGYYSDHNYDHDDCDVYAVLSKDVWCGRCDSCFVSGSCQ